jgi:cold shock CspA family protein
MYTYRHLLEIMCANVRELREGVRVWNECI